MQKHHKPVFMVLLVAIVIAFVFTIGQVPFLGDRNRSWDNAKEFYGYDLSDEGVRSNLQTLAVYDAILGNKNLRTQRQLTQLMLRQAYLLSLARELGIIQVSETELKEYVQSAPAFRNAAGGFDAAAWKKFIAERGRMSEEALSYVIAQNALADKVEKLLGGPGYLPLSYVENQYKKYYGKWDFAVAALSFENFNPEIKVDPSELEKFFKENAEAYRIGDGAVLETVFFPSVKYAASVPAPTNAEISAFYGSNMRKYATQKDGKPYVPALSEIADKVKADALADSALRAAAKAAENLAISIYDSGAKMGSAELKKLVADAKAEVKKLPLIRKTDSELPKGVEISVAQAGMGLDEKTFFSDPIPSENGVTVVILAEKVPSYLPKLADVKGKVEADYKLSQKRKLFSERASALDKALQSAKDEKSFEKIARDGGAKVSDYKDYVIATARPDNASYAVYSAAASELPRLAPGKISPLQTIAGDGYILFASKFTPPAMDASNKDLAEMRANAERSFAEISAGGVVAEMISKESAAAAPAESE